MKLVWGIWVLTQALSTALLARKLPSPRFPCFPWNRQSEISSKQLGAFCSSRGSSKRGYYFTYFLLYSAHHYPISFSFTSPKDWRRVNVPRESEKQRSRVEMKFQFPYLCLR